MLLSQTKEKNVYEISDIEEGKGIKLKLTAMGIVPSIKVKIIKNDFSGPIILAIKASRISLGRGLADKIKVKAI